MNTSITPSTNAFSWQRVSMIARYYYPSLRTQIILYPLISAVLGVIIALGRPSMLSFLTLGPVKASAVMGMLSTMAVGLAGTACQFMFYFAPVTFIRRSRDIDITLPALWKEKATFVMLYLFVFIPVALYVPMFAIRAIGDLISSPEFGTTLFDTGLAIGSQEISLDSLNIFLPMSVCAYVVISRPKTTMARAAGFTILSLVAMGLIGFICYAIWFIPLANGESELLQQSEGLNKVLNANSFTIIRYVISTVTLAFTVMFVWLTIRSFKKIQL